MLITTYSLPPPLRRMRPMRDARDLAELMYRALIKDTRNASQETFIRLEDGSPTWMTAIIREAHGDMLPDDYKYETIKGLLSDLSENDPDTWEDDIRHEIVDSQVDVYTSALIAWLASHIDRVAYLDEAASDGGMAGASNVLMRAQYAEIDEIYGHLVDALRREWETVNDDG